MSPVSGPVLGAAALVASPALLNVLQGTASPSVALTRFLISIAICWMALELLTMVIGPAPRSQSVEPSAETGENAEPKEGSLRGRE